VLLGALSHSGRFRGVFCEQMTFGHVAEAMHRVLVALGGTPRVWRTDRMATIVIPGTDRLTVDAAQAAKHYGVQIAVCPPRRAQRKGVVEAAVKYTTKSWWRSAPAATMAEAQASFDVWCVDVADRRARPGGTAGQVGAAEPLRALPAAAYPAVIAVERKATRSALVAFEANHYSVPPHCAGRTVTVHARVGEPVLRVLSAAGEVVATHRRAPAGAGQILRAPEHAAALERAVLAAFTTDHACPPQAQPAPRPGRAGRARKASGHRSRARPGHLAQALRRAGGGRVLMADTIYQQLREHLHYLGLRAAADQLAPALETAERDKPGYTQFLQDLLATEVTAVEQRRLQGRLRFAKLPARKTLEQFDFSAQPNLDRRLVEDLATLRFVEQKANVLLIGPPGPASHCPPRRRHCANSPASVADI
jgi:IstB-like ATP binding protein/Mu transposase-like protein